MWIMTPFGILMPAIRPTRTVPAGDDRNLQIRARDRRALVHLRTVMGDQLGRIVATPLMDYEYRAYCTHADFAAAAGRLVMAIDYTKFKPQAVSDDLRNVYGQIWQVVFNHYYDKDSPK